MINIKTDSRKVNPGDTFVALRGIRSDGHDYIMDAIKKGAKKIVCEEGKYSVPTLVVSDTRTYLNKILKETYNESFKKITLIGVTGTNGKSTVTHLLREALNKVGLKCAAVGTLGFYVGSNLMEDLENSTPDLCDLYDYISKAIDLNCKYLVMEVSSHSLINGRVETLEFDHAIFTNLTQDHLDFHVTMENYVMAKQQLFKKVKSNGLAIINIDDSSAPNFMLPTNHNITYGYNDADFKIIQDELRENETIFKFSYKKDIYEVNSKLIGRYNIYNVMPVIIFLLYVGIEPIKLLKVIYSLNLPEGRFDVVMYKNNKIIIDYAHTPDAIIKVVETTKQFIKGHIYIVFGCTGERDRLKRPLMAKIVSEEAFRFIITEDDLYYEDFEQIKNDMLLGVNKDNYEIIMDRKEAIIKGISYLDENDALLILGKGHEDMLKIREKRIPFNDKEIVLSYLQNELNYTNK
jgi:UDP-N-acetylmuramoyl-L-alanyl-D-glutamate--2,6-diaminopimelate ligase